MADSKQHKDSKDAESGEPVQLDKEQHQGNRPGSQQQGNQGGGQQQGAEHSQHAERPQHQGGQKK